MSLMHSCCCFFPAVAPKSSACISSRMNNCSQELKDRGLNLTLEEVPVHNSCNCVTDQFVVNKNGKIV